MSKFQHLLDLVLTKKFAFKVIAYFLLICFLYFFRDFLGLFLLTFIFAYLFYSSAKFIKVKFDNLLLKYFSKNIKILKKIFSINFIVIIEYILFLALLIFIISDLIPKFTSELSDLSKMLPFISDYSSELKEKLDNIKTFNNQISSSVEQVFTSKDLDVALEIFDKLKSASFIVMQVLISLILSFIFILDRKKLSNYLLNIKKSSFKFIYNEYKIIFEKILKSFGLIIKAQATIAFTNAILTTLGLVIIGLVHSTNFPYLLTLSLIVFIAGFIPIFGVFISSIPIILIGYSFFGTYTVILEIILLIGIIHLIEAYYLNPKIVSRFLHLPVSMTFIILIVSEKMFGIAGLLIGISFFYFLVGILIDIDKSLKKDKKDRKKLKKKVNKKVQIV